ncbi:helix-turn-helix domain-containing protein [Curtobacterium flaccumfaciens]|uniref:AlbA family DNA-binding domain-containing protein n=1 Tax=Curtobacterium flaccumfaciens TaxID=2035 RepID=UPI0013754FC2|nr:ATP-binding protein [Curtobacterium flaccumfaciens]
MGGIGVSLLQSRIHRHLSLPARELTFDDVERAVADGLTEERDLDWKTTPPKDVRGEGGDEFAKDVTAMANTTGGLLVYGVSEQQRRVGIANDVDDTMLRMFEQLLLHRTAPHVRDVSFRRLVSADNSNRSVLLVSVPESVDAPHVIVGVGGQPKLRAAMRGWERRGSDSVEMDEPAMALAYRRRFDAYSSIETRAAELRGFAFDHCAGRSATAWLLVAAVPVRPVAVPPRADRTAVASRLGKAVADGGRGAPNEAETLGALRPIWDNPRAGYGRWVVSNFVAPQDAGVGRPAYVELHHDGAVVVAVDVSWGLTAPSEPVALVNIGAVERLMSEVVFLAHIHGTEAGFNSAIGFSAQLCRADEKPGPFEAVRSTLLRTEHRDGWTRRVRRAQVVRSEAGAVRTEAELAATVHDLGDGVLSQFGVMTELARPVR